MVKANYGIGLWACAILSYQPTHYNILNQNKKKRLILKAEKGDHMDNHTSQKGKARSSSFGSSSRAQKKNYQLKLDTLSPWGAHNYLDIIDVVTLISSKC